MRCAGRRLLSHVFVCHRAVGFGLLIWTTVASANQLPQKFNFDGVLQDSGGNPIIGAATQLRFQIYDPSGTCLLYDELQTIDMSASPSGAFSVKIGSPVGSG